MAAGSIIIDLLMKTGQFETDTKRAEKSLKAFEKSAVETGKKVGLAAVAITAAVAASVKLTINQFDDMAKASQKVGLTTEALSGLRYAADLSGVSFEGLQTALGKLSKGIEDFRDGTTTAVESFGKLNLDPTKFATTEDALKAIADRFAQMPDGAQKTAIAMELLGKSGRELIPLLNSGSDGISAMTAEAEKLGVVIDSQAAKAAERFNDNLTRLNAGVTGLRNQMAVYLLPTLVDVSDGFIDALLAVDRFENENKGMTAVDDLAVGFARLVDILIVIPKLISAVASSFKVVYSDLKFLSTLNPGIWTAQLVGGNNPFTEIGKALDERNQTLADSNREYERLWNSDARKFEQAVSGRIQFRIDYLNQYAQRALEVQQAYINESVEIQQAAQMELAKNLGYAPKMGSFEVAQVSGTSGKSDAEKAAEASAKAAETFINALKKEAETLGLTEIQLKQYEASQLKLNSTQKQSVSELLLKIDAYKTEEERLKALTESLIEFDRIMTESGDRELDALMESQASEGAFMQGIQDYVDSVLKANDPTIELTENIGKLQSALSLGFIDDETYERLALFLEEQAKSVKEETDFIKSIADSAAKSIQSSFADFLFDPFKSGVNGMLQEFITVLRRMAAEALASQIFKMLGNKFGGSGGFLGAIFSAFGGGKAGGGDVMENRSYLVGENGPEMFVPRTAGTIVPNSSMGNTTPQVNIRNINVLDPAVVGEYLNTDAGEQIIMNVMQRNRRALNF